MKNISCIRWQCWREYIYHIYFHNDTYSNMKSFQQTSVRATDHKAEVSHKNWSVEDDVRSQWAVAEVIKSHQSQSLISCRRPCALDYALIISHLAPIPRSPRSVLTPIPQVVAILFIIVKVKPGPSPIPTVKASLATIYGWPARGRSVRPANTDAHLLVRQWA